MGGIDLRDVATTDGVFTGVDIFLQVEPAPHDERLTGDVTDDFANQRARA